MQIYVAKRGDTISGIAGQFGVVPALLAADNGLALDARLAVGQTLVIRFPKTIHTVSAGETIYSIALQYGVSTLTLYRNNFFLQGLPTVRSGDILVIEYEQESKLGTFGVNGYAYPYIDIAQLDATLPYLTYLTPFTYGISADGGLLPLNDAELLAAAGHYRTVGLMHLSTLTEEGSFSNDRSSVLLASEEKQERLILSIIQNLRRKNYFGLDVDFEFVYPEEREAYAAFIAKLRDRLNPLGYPVIVALAPKTSAEQQGLLYESHDYALLGQAANAVFLMTYEWGYTYGPPMAVAPLPQVRAVLDYAVTEIPPENIFMGIPLYGYDWTLPFQQGASKAESLSPKRAVELAVQYGAEIFYDEVSQAPYFYYTPRSGREHVVWFEDARSMEAKLRLAAEYGFQGIGFWNLMREMPQLWPLLDSLYDVEIIE